MLPCSLRLRFATHGLLFHVFPSLSSRTRFLRVFLSRVPSTSLVFVNYVFKYCAQYPNHGSGFRLFLFPCPLFLFSLPPGRSLVCVLSHLVPESPARYDRHASNLNYKLSSSWFVVFLEEVRIWTFSTSTGVQIAITLCEVQPTLIRMHWESSEKANATERVYRSYRC